MIRRLFLDVRPVDLAMLVIELLVLILIAYEVGYSVYRRRKIHNRSKAIFGFVTRGQTLRATAPKLAASDADVSAWRKSVETWITETHNFLARYSSEAAASFIHNAGRMAADYMGIAVTCHGHYGTLGERLNNLRNIMEKADVYF